MRKLLMTRGLPGSGKSTWATEEKLRLEAEGVKVRIICKDDIRAELAKTGWVWSKKAEADVLKFQASEILGSFARGTDVCIISDTNFGKHKQRLQNIAKQCEAEFEVKDFTAVPLDVCIERDAKRANSVGADVIKEMYVKYVHLPVVEPYVADWSKPIALICDLDGTVALHEGKRSPYDFGKCGLDVVNEPVANAVRLFAKSAGYSIVYCSGRDGGVARTLTENWLQANGLPYGDPHQLLMRPAGDSRKDYIVKQELFDNHIRKQYNVRFVLDDRTQVVKMWRALGISTWQVNEGDF